MSEAATLGLTRGNIRAAIRRGECRSPVSGVLVMSGAPSTWFQDRAIATTAARGVLSHRAAARLHHLDGFETADVEMTIPAARHWKGDTATVHRAARLDPPDITEVDGIAVTSIARTIVDLGAVVDGDAVEQALDDALRRGVSARWISQTMDRLSRPGVTGVGALRSVLARADRAGRLADSKFERRAERLCVRAGLPQPERQVRVHDANGRLVVVLDMAWPDRHLAVEAHSQRWHSGARRGRQDQTRDNRLTALGWELLYASWEDVEDGDEFALLLRAAYDLRAPW